MAFSELELKRIVHTVGEFCRKRSLVQIKDKLRLEYTVKGHEVVMFERRPRWDNPHGVDEISGGQAQIHPLSQQMATLLAAFGHETA
ncbi:MAG: hypothetical protein L0H94_13965 [Nitrospira sp.]|nr:hypothetical protein [Nitrospira sp.]